MANDNHVLSIGLLGAGGKLVLDDLFLSFSHPYGRAFRVRRSDIQIVTVDSLGWGKGTLRIVGGGTTLASVEMPIAWANKCEEWIHDNLLRVDSSGAGVPERPATPPAPASDDRLRPPSPPKLTA